MSDAYSMVDRKPIPWIWLGPLLVGFAHWQRTYANKIWGQNPAPRVEMEYVAERVMPYFWRTAGLALAVLLVFGRTRKALGPWISAIVGFGLGWLVPTVS